MKILEAVDITKVYQRNEFSVMAIKHINLSVEKGEFIAVMGTSGSGKSTLLRILGGLDVPTAGSVVVEGNDITKECLNEEEYSGKKVELVDIDSMNDRMLSAYRREKTGFIFQEYNLLPILTLKENIELPIRLSGHRVDKNYINELLEIFHIKDRKDHYPHQVSGGQQQRAAIARALANKPSIIWADEPTGNLDRQNRLEVLEHLKKCNTIFGQTLIMVTHDGEIAKNAHRVIMLEDGEIVD